MPKGPFGAMTLAPYALPEGASAYCTFRCCPIGASLSPFGGQSEECPKGATTNSFQIYKARIAPEGQQQHVPQYMPTGLVQSTNKGPSGEEMANAPERSPLTLPLFGKAEWGPGGQDKEPFGHIFMRSPKGRAHTAPLGAGGRLVLYIASRCPPSGNICPKGLRLPSGERDALWASLSSRRGERQRGLPLWGNDKAARRGHIRSGPPLRPLWGNLLCFPAKRDTNLPPSGALGPLWAYIAGRNICRYNKASPLGPAIYAQKGCASLSSAVGHLFLPKGDVAPLGIYCRRGATRGNILTPEGPFGLGEELPLRAQRGLRAH